MKTTVQKENIRKAIAVMERVKRHEIGNRNLLDMRFYNTAAYYDIQPYAEERILECGTTCCFAGWLAISPEFNDLGVVPTLGGAPCLPKLGVSETFEILFGINSTTCDNLIYGFNSYYSKRHKDVTVDDVIRKLNDILTESDE